MSKIFTPILMLCLSVGMFSCQKVIDPIVETTPPATTPIPVPPTTTPPPTNPPVSGNVDFLGVWKFQYMEVKLSNSQQSGSGSTAQKTVTKMNYVTTDNAGTITFDATQVKSSNIAYSANTITTSYIYVGGSLIDSISLPTVITTPVSSATANYTKIGTDSIYMESGSMLMSGSVQNSAPAGAKLKRENNTLIMTQSVLQNTTSTMQGQTITTMLDVQIRVFMIKQ